MSSPSGRGVKRKSLQIVGEMSRKYADDPIGWIHRYFSFPPPGALTDQQKEIALAVQRDRFVAVGAGGGIGKTAVAALLGLWAIATHVEAVVGVTAPVGPQLESILWPEFDKWLSRCSCSAIFRYTSRFITIRGFRKWGIFKRVARKEQKDVSDTLAGFHAPWLMFLVDEAAGVRSQVFTAIDGAMTQEESRALLISNPTSSGGYFYDIITSDDGKGYKLLQYSSNDSPLVSPTYKELIARRWGEDSPMYRIKVLGLPVESTEGVVVPPQLYDRVVKEQRSWSDGPTVVGVDVGGEGPDPTVACVKTGVSVRAWKEISDPDPERGATILVDWIHGLGIKGTVVLVVDAIGVGFGFYKALQRLSPWRVVKHEGSAKAENEEMFDSRRAEVFWLLHKTFKDLHFPTSPPERLRKELANLRFSFDKDKVGMVPKKKFRGEMGFSPNYSDALSLTGALGRFAWSRRHVNMPKRVMPMTMVTGGGDWINRFL